MQLEAAVASAAAATAEASVARDALGAANERAAAAEEQATQARADAQASAALAERLAVGSAPSPSHKAGADDDSSRRGSPAPGEPEGRRRTASRASRTLMKQVNATQAQASQLRTELAAAKRREAVNADITAGLQRQVKAVTAELAAANEALEAARAAPPAQVPAVEVPVVASGETRALMEQIGDLTKQLCVRRPVVGGAVLRLPAAQGPTLTVLPPPAPHPPSAPLVAQVHRHRGAAAHGRQGSAAAAHVERARRGGSGGGRGSLAGARPADGGGCGGACGAGAGA